MALLGLLGVLAWLAFAVRGSHSHSQRLTRLQIATASGGCNTQQVEKELEVSCPLPHRWGESAFAAAGGGRPLLASRSFLRLLPQLPPTPALPPTRIIVDDLVAHLEQRLHAASVTLLLLVPANRTADFLLNVARLEETTSNAQPIKVQTVRTARDLAAANITLSAASKVAVLAQAPSPGQLGLRQGELIAAISRQLGTSRVVSLTYR